MLRSLGYVGKIVSVASAINMLVSWQEPASYANHRFATFTYVGVFQRVCTFCALACTSALEHQS